MPHQGYANINTAANDHRSGVVLEGMMPLTGTTNALSISAGYVDGREVLADTSVTVTVASTTYRGYLVSEDGAGAFVVTMGTDDVGATEALALADALLIEVPTGDVGVFAGVIDTTTAVALLKDNSVRGKLPFALIAADETITL
jgi:hypothetical protein